MRAIAGCLMSFCLVAAAADPVSRADLRSELLKMAEADQVPRRTMDVGAMQSVDLRNTARLKQIIEEIGWPTAEAVGEDGATAAWLIAQHADADHAFQNHVLDLIKPLMESGRVPRRHYAYLYDRIHRPQRYGTQGTCIANGKWSPRELEEPSRLDELRKEMGLPPMSEYQASVSKSCNMRPVPRPPPY